VPRSDRSLAPLWPLIFAALALLEPARAQETPQSQLDAVQKELEQSKQQQQNFTRQSAALGAEIEQLRAQQVAAAQSAQAHEAALTRLDAERAKLVQDIKVKGDELQKRQSEQQALLAALLHLARNPPIGLALADGTPIDLLRGGILMGTAVPPLVERGKRLGVELQSMNALQDELRDAEARHRAEADALAKEQIKLAALANQKTVLQRQAAEGAAATAQQIEGLASQARDLKDLIERADAAQHAREAREAREAEARRKREAEARLAAAAAAARQPAARPDADNSAEQQAVATAPPRPDAARPAGNRPFAQAKGRMVLPAAGEMVASFGSAAPTGEPAKGITFATRPDAAVVAPFDGRVVFAGAFRGYGQILIIGHGDGYHSLVAGLDRIDTSVGQVVVAGEPIGRMSANEAKPRLYLELRHNGQPINPLPWLATRDAKVKG
jgi:murein hydrolase activator